MSTETTHSLRPADPVGILEIAERLGVPVRTVHTWRYRHALPDPDYTAINGSRAWEWNRILLWAGETGRLRRPEHYEEYRRQTGREPTPNWPTHPRTEPEESTG